MHITHLFQSKWSKLSFETENSCNFVSSQLAKSYFLLSLSHEEIEDPNNQLKLDSGISNGHIFSVCAFHMLGDNQINDTHDHDGNVQKCYFHILM